MNRIIDFNARRITQIETIFCRILNLHTSEIEFETTENYLALIAISIIREDCHFIAFSCTPIASDDVTVSAD